MVGHIIFVIAVQQLTSHLCHYRGDQMSFSHQLLYHIMTLLKSCTDKSFEIVIDLTQATQINEPDVSSQNSLLVLPLGGQHCSILNSIDTLSRRLFR